MKSDTVKALFRLAIFVNFFCFFSTHAQTSRSDYRLLLKQSQDEEKAKIYLDWSRDYFENLNLHDSSRLLANEGIAFAEKNNQTSVKAELLTMTGRYFTYKVQVDSAVACFDKAVALIGEDDFELLTRIIDLKLEVLLVGHRYHDVISFAEPYIELKEISKYKQRWANILLSVADAYSRTFQHEEGLQYANMTLHLSQEEEDYDMVIDAYILISGIFSNQGKYFQALDAMQKAFDYEEHMDLNQRAVTYGNLGVSYVRVELYEKAVEAYQKALELKDNLPEHFEPWVIGRVGSVYLQKGDYENALAYYVRASSMYRMLKMETDAIYNDLFIVKCYARQGNWVKARETAQSVEKKITRFPNSQGRLNYVLAYTYFWLAKTDLAFDDLRDAKEHVDQCLNYSEKVRNVELEKEVSELAADVYERNGLSRRALPFLKRFIVLKDSMSNNNLEAKMVSWESRAVLQKKDFENAQLRLSNENLALKRKSLITAIIAITLSAAIIVWLLVFRLKIKKRNLALVAHENELNKELSDRQSEVVTLKNQLLEAELKQHSMQLLNKNRIINQMKEQLSTSGKREGNRIQMIPDVSDILSKNLNSDKDWDEFKLHFEQIHPGFFASLLQQYANITHNELRISALLKLNLSTKEIASILNIQPESVRKSCHRLRVKIGLEDDKALRRVMIQA